MGAGEVVGQCKQGTDTPFTVHHFCMYVIQTYLRKKTSLLSTFSAEYNLRPLLAKSWALTGSRVSVTFQFIFILLYNERNLANGDFVYFTHV